MNDIRLNMAIEQFKKALNNSIKAEQMKSDWRTMAKQSTVSRQVTTCKK